MIDDLHCLLFYQVILGGGRKYFLPSTTEDPECLGTYGARQDGRNLTQVMCRNWSLVYEGVPGRHPEPLLLPHENPFLVHSFKTRSH